VRSTPIHRELYKRYLTTRVGRRSWRRFFAEFGDDAAAFRAERAGRWSRPAVHALLRPETAGRRNQRPIRVGQQALRYRSAALT